MRFQNNNSTESNVVFGRKIHIGMRELGLVFLLEDFTRHISRSSQEERRTKKFGICLTVSEGINL